MHYAKQKRQDKATHRFLALLICHPTGDNGLHMEIQSIFHFQFEWNSTEPTLIKIIMSNNQTNKTNMFGKT